MDKCYISYIFTDTLGYRIPFSKDKSVQQIGNALRKYGGKKYIFLLRFQPGENKEIILTLWIPSYYKIGDLNYPNWYSSIKTYPKDSILITPRGEFKLNEVDPNFFEYCKTHYKIN